MDHTLKGLISSLASNLLSTSTQFEPYIPNSKQNLYYSLNLLSGLGDLAHASLESDAAQLAIAAPTHLLPVPKVELTLAQKQAAILTRPAHPPETSPVSAPVPSPVSSKEELKAASRERSREVDRSLLQALQTLRESKQFQRKTMGVFSPILRGNL